MRRLPFGRPLSWRADSPLQRLKREQKREYVYSNSISKILERDYEFLKGVSETTPGKILTNIFTWADIPYGLGKTLLSKALVAGILKEHALAHISQNVKKALKAGYLKNIGAARNFYLEIKNTPQSLLDKIKHLREGVPAFYKTAEGKRHRITSQSRVLFKPTRKDVDLIYWLRNLKDPHTAAHELGHVATLTRPELGKKLFDYHRSFGFYFPNALGISRPNFYELYDPAEYAARYFQHYLGPALTKGKVSEAAIETAVKDIEARLKQYEQVLKYMKLEKGPKLFLKELYKKGIVEKVPPAFRQGRTLIDDPEAYKKVAKILYWY